MSATWILNLNIGDRVGMIRTSSHGDLVKHAFHVVARKTPSGQVVLDNGFRFNDRGQQQVTGSVAKMFAHIITPATQLEERLASDDARRQQTNDARAFRAFACSVIDNHSNCHGDFFGMTADEKAKLLELLNAVAVK